MACLCKPDSREADRLKEIVEAQIQQQGVATFQASDGQVFVFTTATLELLLARAIESGEGRAVVFVKRGTVQ